MTLFLKELCLGEDNAEYPPPQPDTFIPLFVNQHSCLIEFLEAVVEHQSTPSSQVGIINSATEKHADNTKLVPKDLYY